MNCRRESQLGNGSRKEKTLEVYALVENTKWEADSETLSWCSKWETRVALPQVRPKDDR